VHGTTMPPAPSGTHTPPRPPAGIRRPLGVLQNAWLEPGRDDRLNRNQLPLNTDTFGRRGGSCSKQTLVITTPCSSPNTRSALSALGPPLVEMKCAIDSPSRCPASRAGLFGALAQAAFAMRRQLALRRLASTALATTAPRDSRRNTPPPPALAASHVPYRTVRRPPDRLARSHHRTSRARASPRPPHHRRQPWARNRHATHARTPAALAVPLAPPGTASTHAGAASDACGPRSSPLRSLAQEADGSGGQVWGGSGGGILSSSCSLRSAPVRGCS
jgi:hypothetical protein